MKSFASRSPRIRALFCSTALIGTLFGMASAIAQDASGLEVITVTARRRSEDIEKVPAQITAFTAADINAKGIESPKDFLNSIPNVSFVPTQNAGTSFIVIRGIGQARNSEPSAAIVVDGVPMTQPAEFNQDLLDIQQIEVLKGPQGALYGRDAIGGAILITTKQPGDEWEGQAKAGYDNGPGYKVEGEVSGPVTDTLKMRIAASYLDTDGRLRNADTVDPSAKRDADPVKDFNARISLLWTPTSNFTADLRLSTDLLDTRGLYYIVPPLGTKESNDPDYTKQPINLNNSGEDDRKIYDAALKLNYEVGGGGNIQSITSYSTVWEILTGDGFSFDPFGHSKIFFDFGQSQFLTAKTFTQELRYTSNVDSHFRYIVGAEVFDTSRFISTGNMFDFDTGVQPEYRTPNPPLFQPNGQISFLADSQRQFAWAGYIDTSTDITDKLELSVNVRYDRDHRRNTADTPQIFLPAPGITGEQRSHTWEAFQPQVILKYQWTDNLSVYADFSRGFRSGGFNQTGVATAAAAEGFFDVGDMFRANLANTWEAGFKSRWFDDRLALNGSIYRTNDHDDYYFVFIASNSTQNLGNIPLTRLQGFDLDATGKLDDNWLINAGFGMTDSNIRKFPDPLVIGAKSPLTSDYTANVGIQYDHTAWAGWNFEGRVDYDLTGPTTFAIPISAAAVNEPVPQERNPLGLVDVRASLLSDDGWQLTAWSKNLFDKKYNTEYSTGGFLFKGEPRTWGLEVSKRF
ncbi:MAG TPA: TonB-dependent receptor [Rhizomicrobium sp.]|jgi:iron complex outermembrane receptor protein